MPTKRTFASTKEEWKRLADIDYFGMYVKAYIPFNAWMNLKFALKEDRAKINAIKNSFNTFRDKIVALLQDDSQEGADFRARLGELHNVLEQAQIHNQDRRISFCEIRFKNNGPYSCDKDTHGVHFHVHCGDMKHPFEGETLLSIKGHKRTGGEITHFCKRYNEYEPDTQKVWNDMSKIKPEWAQRLLSMYQSVAPLLVINLVNGKPNKRGKPNTAIECGRFCFVPNVEQVAQGIIEVLYNLRNALFHGEITPNADANKVYGAAYHILRRLIECL